MQDNIANAVIPADPLAEGQHYFLYETWGAETRNEWPPAWFLLDLMENDPRFWGQMGAWGTVFDPYDNFPVGLKRGTQDRERVATTCAFCHVSVVDGGRRWMGAPARRLDYGQLRIALNEAWVEAGYEPFLTDLEVEKLASLGPGRADVSGPHDSRAVPVDFPAYFHLQNKTALNHLGTGGDLRSEMAMHLFTRGVGAPADDPHGAIAFPSADKMQAFELFLGNLHPPERVNELRPNLVDRGEEVFVEAGCNKCHFPAEVESHFVVTHREDGPELMPGDVDEFSRGVVRTSGARRLLAAPPIAFSNVATSAAADAGTVADGGADAGIGLEINAEVLQRSFFAASHGYAVRTTDGYRTPDLAGLWTTAPYLHNGSVPSLEALLSKASDRPESFAVVGTTRTTDTFGNSNEGHEWGAELTGAQKEALIEYLKSL